MKIVVFTALFGDKDTLRTPFEYRVEENIDYVCITDNRDITSDVYKIIFTKRKFKDITKNARYYKIKGFRGIENYDISIWHDANIEIKQNEIKNLSSYVEHSEFATFKHPVRSCVYEEGLACITRRKDYALRIFFQLFVLFLHKYPNNAGLFETGILVTNISRYRKKKMHLIWWKWVSSLSRRDQLSLGISVFKTNAVYAFIPGNGENNKFSIFHKHQYDYYKDRSFYAFFNNQFIILLAQKGIKKFILLNKYKRNVSIKDN